MPEPDIEREIKKARVQLLFDRPFYGNLAMNLNLEEMPGWMEDEITGMGSIPTMCTDGKAIYYNRDFVRMLLGSSTSPDNQKLQLVLMHEVLHLALLHLLRQGERNPMRWQFAVDYCTNSIIYQEFGKVLLGMLYESKFDDMTAEAIYNLLPEMRGSSGCRRYGNKQVTVEIDKEGNIRVNGKKVKFYDNHRAIKGTKEEMDALEKEWKIKVSKAYHQAKKAGKHPIGMDIFIEELIQPKLKWHILMKQFIISTSKSDYTWLKPNKRFVHQGMYLPSMTGESLGDVAIIVDNSGSTLSEQQKFFSEVNGLLQQYEVNLHLVVTDMQVNSYKVYHKGDKIDLQYKGGGGSDLKPAFKFIDEKRINPNLCIILSDGFIDVPEHKPQFPVLWVLNKNGVEEDKIKFGMVIRITE